MLVQVHTCGINFWGRVIVQDEYQGGFDLHFTPGMEIFGTVIAHGDSVTTPAIATRIWAYAGSGEPIE